MSITEKMFDAIPDKEHYKFNYWIGTGFAAYEMKQMVTKLTTLLKDVCRKPKGNQPWLEFVELRRLTEQEEYEYIVNGNLPQFLDITKSDFILYKYTFIYHINGKEHPIEKYQYLPAVNWRDSSIRISGTKWYLTPIYTDPKLAPLPSGIGLFSKLYKNKANILSEKHLYLVNGKRVLKKFIYMENFYTLNKIEKNYKEEYKRLTSPLVAYLLINNSIKEVVSRYGRGIYGDDFVILNGDYKMNKEYDYIGSTKLQHEHISINYPERHNYTIRVKRGSSRLLYELAYAIIYMMDASPELADRVYKSLDTQWERDAWRLLLGFVTFRGAFEAGYTIKTLGEHMRKVDSYIDTLISRDLYDDLGITVNNIEDYIKETIELYPKLTDKGQNYHLVVRDKKLEVLYYVLYILINKINKNIDDINQKIYFDRDFSLKHVQQVLKNTFKPKELFNISKGGAEQILPLVLFNSTRDNRIYSVTTLLDVQERGNGPFKRISKSNKFPQSLKILAGIDPLRGSMNYLYKGAPSIRLRASPLNEWEGANIKFKPDLVEIMDRLDRELNSYRADKISSDIIETIDVTYDEDLDKE